MGPEKNQMFPLLHSKTIYDRMVFEYRPLLFGGENGKKATKTEEKG
jgi:hypothetical protein